MHPEVDCKYTFNYALLLRDPIHSEGTIATHNFKWVKMTHIC